MKIKNLKHRIGISEQQTSGKIFRAFFFHPDYTVGPGISPSHAFAEWRPLAGCTAGRELHPALKNQIFGFAGQSLYRFARAKYNPKREKMQEFFVKNKFTEFDNSDKAQ